MLADRLLGDGEEQVPAIPHWVSKPAKVYPAILHGRTSELQRLQEPLPALMADVDDEVPHPALAAVPRAAAGEVQDEVADAGLEGQGSAQASDADSDSVLRELERLMEADEVDSVGENQSVDCAEAAVEVDDLQDVHAHASEAHAEEVQEEPVSVPPDVDHHVAEPASADASDVGSPEQIIAALREPFGPFRFTYKRPQKHVGRGFGGVQVTCPFHRKNSQTGCKKFLGLRNASTQELDAAVRAVKGWALSYDLYSRQRDHLHHVCSADMAPDASISAAVLLLADVEVPHVSKTDVELDREAGAAASSSAKAKSRAVPGPKAKPKPRGKSKAHAASRVRDQTRPPAHPPSDEAGSDPDSDSPDRTRL